MCVSHRSPQILRRSMAAGDHNPNDFYAVLGLNKDCSDADLRNAYKKLALRWHPDRCQASGKSKDEAKEKFQAIQEAYSVLSDSSKRLMYDIGVYDSEFEEDGMGDFLGEMTELMSRTKPSEGGHESFEDLQRLFVEMFQADIDAGYGGETPAAANNGWYCAESSSSTTVPLSNKRGSSAMTSAAKTEFDHLDLGDGGFCFGSTKTLGEQPSKGGSSSSSSKRRTGRKQKASSSKHNVSSREAYDNTLVH